MEKNINSAPSAPPIGHKESTASHPEPVVAAVPVFSNVVIQSQPQSQPNTDQSRLIPVPIDYIDFSAGKPVPDYYHQCPALFCAFRYEYCDFPACFGCKGMCQCLCCEGEGLWCKYGSNDARTCCVFCSGSEEIVNCATACKCYSQCCCIDIICGIPYNTAFVTTDIMFKNVPNRDGIDSLDRSIICNACFCELDNCYCNFPACCSGFQKSTCLCCESQQVCCKALCFDSGRKKRNTLCLCNKSHTSIVYPTVCCKGVSQCCCWDNRCAFPCDEDVPFACTLLPFCMCCPKIGCCLTVGGMRTKKIGSAP